MTKWNRTRQAEGNPPRVPPDSMIKRLLTSGIVGSVLLATAWADEPGQDGLTAKTAAVIVARDEKDGPPKEVAWVVQHYPGCKIQRFVTRPAKEGKVYDVFFIRTAEGKRQELYFEISSFYHKT